jgi:phage baseplate assembly protein W
MSVDFLGAGWNFPLQIDPTNSVALASNVRDIEQAIEIIIRTSPGERPMRPEFGCRIQDHLFSPVNEATAAAIAYDVRRALELWEPRIDVESVQVTADNQDLGTFYIDVGYRVRGYNDPRNLVFPFYVIPDESNVLTTTELPPMALPSPVPPSAPSMLSEA